ncbi:MAG TPA: hypothetical protein VFU59_12725 [Candidatus Eisenbacteria bacterium]|nr:hypothetical protein [Candidatus Eisenbacteria bacterium]
MPLLLSICIVLATASAVVVAVVAIRALALFGRASRELEQSAQSLRDCAAQAKSTGREVEHLIASLREVVPPVRRAAQAFGQVGERAAELSAAVLNEVETPIRRTMDLIRGAQAGAGYFLNRLARNGPAAKNGGNYDERARSHQ